MATREERSFNFAIFRRVRDNDVDFFGGGGFFLKKGKGVFLSGFRPPRIRAVRTAGMQDGAARQGCRAAFVKKREVDISCRFYEDIVAV